MPRRTNDELSPKEKLFVSAYIANDFNATQAAIEAGYSKKTAGVIGFENLRKPKIQQALAQATRKTAEKLGFRAEDVIGGLIKIANADIRDILSFGSEDVELPAVTNGEGQVIVAARKERRNVVKLKESHELSDAAAYPITGITQKADGSVSLKFADKKGALDTLARHMDLVKDQLELSQPGGKPLVSGDPREVARLVALALAKAGRAKGGGPSA